ncbi:autotransporter outer membrane beta-barrel domain-containing protein [Yersinia massiliensis]|uniref:autotransporter outer membrane beta-barrel domain-containing protein n=1 Tax=Yersinia massiliensis TaxID=419257 RepID=UPI0002DD28E0|nr:autotransporter outer membrane beta-barrel domain-containing protein [Yersinia massiliensis]
MKNKIKSQTITQENVKNSQKNGLSGINKTPIALCMTTAILMLGHPSAMADNYYREDINNDTVLNAYDRAVEVTLGEGVWLTLRDETQIQETKIEAGRTVSLHDKSSAKHIRVQGGQLQLHGNEHGEAAIAEDIYIYSGGVSVSTTATISDTVIEPKPLDKSAPPVLYLSNDSNALDTKVYKGGELFVQGSQITQDEKGVTLENTQVAGELRLRSDVTLTGKTDFLPTSTLETKGHLIRNQGELIFDINNDTNINASIDGLGSLTKEGKVTLTLFGKDKSKGHILSPDFVYEGDTNINDGTLKLSNAIFLKSKINGQQDTQLVLEKTTLTTAIQGGNLLIGENSVWNMTKNSNINDLILSKTSTINLSPTEIGNKLIIDGNYAGKYGTLLFQTELEGDNSITDHILIKGDTAGYSRVRIVNSHGNGAETKIGIPLIEVLGISDGVFEQLGRNKAGAFEYKLGRGEGERHKNWYLRSSLADYDAGQTTPIATKLTEHASSDEARPDAPVVPAVPVVSTAAVMPTATVVPTATVAPAAAVVPTATVVPAAAVVPAPASQPQVYAPENGSYIANIVMARNLFNTRLEDRTGSYQYQDAISGQWQTASMWMHTQGGKNNFGQAVEQLDVHGKYYSVQLGMDVIQAGNGRLGMLAGLGRATNHSRSNVTGYYANGAVSGYNLGVYASWLPEQQDNTGFYFDTLAQYSWFNNTVNGQEQVEDKYKSSGFTTSIESGYTFKMATTNQLNYFVQPNAQLTLQGIQTQTHKTVYGESISDSNKGHMVTRIGAKTYLQTVDSADSQFTPFFAINWRHQNQNTGAIISGQRVENKSKNSTEFQIGVESKIEQQLHVWATIDYQMGRYNDKNANAVAGIKYHF